MLTLSTPNLYFQARPLFWTPGSQICTWFFSIWMLHSHLNLACLKELLFLSNPLLPKCFPFHPNSEHHHLPSCSCQKPQSHPNCSFPHSSCWICQQDPLFLSPKDIAYSCPSLCLHCHHSRAGCYCSFLIALSLLLPLSNSFSTHLQGVSFSCCFLKTLQWLLIEFRINSKLLTMAYMFRSLPTSARASWFPPCSLPFNHNILSDAQTGQCISASGPLHILFPQPELFFSALFPSFFLILQIFSKRPRHQGGLLYPLCLSWNLCSCQFQILVS